MEKVLLGIILTLLFTSQAFSQATGYINNGGACGSGGGVADPNGSLAALAATTITQSGSNYTFPGTITTTAADGARVMLVQSNTSYTPTASTYGVVAVGTALSLLENGALYTPVRSGGALGTPSSGTLSSCSGLPVSGITASTSQALGVGSIELGHASDTTIARASAGVVSVEGLSLPRIVASGAVTNDSSSISSGACTTAIDGGTATGVATTDRIVWNFNGDPTGITGFSASASGGLFIYAYPSTDHVNFKICNNTAGAIDPSSITLNWMVLR